MELIRVGTAGGVRLNALGKRRITIGRSTECDVVLVDATVSRLHASIELVGNSWRIVDKGSRNGVYVNGVRASRATPIRSGDRISLGDASFQVGEASPSMEDQELTRQPRVVFEGVPLTPRETEVLLQVALGLTDEQIAERVTISIKTVRTHLDRIRDKTGCRRRAELTRLAVEAGLLGDERVS
ncbi:MAG: FHA domain-containing protein [Actinobacteria bacterium]|nr:FHA domain-containing protein [Actinomycetota bacterium]